MPEPIQTPEPLPLRVSVILLAYNQAPGVRRALAALEQSERRQQIGHLFAFGSQPFGDLINALSFFFMYMVPRDFDPKNPDGTGPFKLAEWKRGQYLRLARNPDYFKKGLPYLDAIEIPIVPARGTAILGFVSNRYDLTSPYGITIPLLKDVKSQSPNAICEAASMNNNTNLILNREAAPFDNPEIRAVWEKKAALRRLGQPIDIARGALLLASNEADFITGHELVVDGGLTLRT